MRAHAPLVMLRVEPRRNRLLRCGAGAILVVAISACAPGVSTTQLGPPATAADRARLVRMQLEYARQFEDQGRSELAERSLREAVAYGPDDPTGLRALARFLEQSGRADEAAPLRRRADAIDPPPAAPSDAPVAADTAGWLVLVVPASLRGPTAGVAAPAPDPLARDALLARVAVRLPGARVASPDPASVDEARAWLRAQDARRVLSLSLERADCGSSRKDGAFARVWLRAVAATPAGVASPALVVREIDRDPAGGQICVVRPVGQAFERVLGDPAVWASLASAPASAGAWPSPALRDLFPGLDARLEAALERGRAELARGRLAAAERAFAGALAIDPDDADARAFLDETRSSLALSRDLHGGTGVLEEPASDDVALSPAERDAAERDLADEQHRRDQLLAAVAVLSGDEPDPGQLRDALRPVELPGEESVGLRLARERSPGPIERRALFAPDGRPLASWYFDAASGSPLLREEDRNHDGRAETWAVWRGGRRSEVLEDRGGSGRPDTRVSLGPDGSVTRIEMTSGPATSPSRVFEYGDGRLLRESRDTNGDGRLDRFETFDAEGAVRERAEDLDGDGQVDVRSFYESGKLVRREVSDPGRVKEMM